MQPIRIPADQFADVLAAGAVTASRDLLVDEILEGLGQRDIHRAHDPTLGELAKFGKAWSDTAGVWSVKLDCLNSVSGRPG